jgi:hypothetical protein
MMYLYAATCHVVALSEISVHVSLVSDTGVQVSEVLGIAPHPNPMIVPTALVAPLPIISIEMTFETVPTDPVPLTPVMAWNDMTSALIVPTEPVLLLPVAIGAARIVPRDPVDALPVMATEYVIPTVPTLPVPIAPSSWIDLLDSSVPMASVDALPVNAALASPMLQGP